MIESLRGFCEPDTVVLAVPHGEPGEGAGEGVRLAERERARSNSTFQHLPRTVLEPDAVFLAE